MLFGPKYSKAAIVAWYNTTSYNVQGSQKRSNFLVSHEIEPSTTVTRGSENAVNIVYIH